MEFSLFQMCRSFWLIVVRIVLFLLLLIILIPLGLPYAIMWMYMLRTLVANIAHLVYGKKLGKLLTTRGACLAQDNIYTKPHSNIVVRLIFSGRIGIDELRDLVRLRLLQQYLPGAEEKYPELKQYLFPFFGYYFWKNCESFDICEHVKEVKPQTTADDQQLIVDNFVQSCVNEPWIEEKPLWEMNLINWTDSSEEMKEQSALILKIHHSLADGFSLLSLLRNDLCGNANQLKAEIAEEQEVEASKSSVGQRAVYIVTFLFRVSWDMSQVLLDCLLPSVWKPKRQSQSQTWNLISEKVPLEKLKDIKNHFKVSFSSLVVNLVSGGIRNALLVSSKKDGSRSKTDKVLCQIPVPLYPRGPKLRNFMAESLLYLPLELSDSVERLRKCNEIVHNATRSPSVEFISWIFMTMGSTPNFLANFLLRHMPTTAIISNFPGGIGDACIYTNSGNKITCTDASFTMGPTTPTIGTGFTILSYGNFFRFSVIASKSLYSKQQAELLLSEILKEFEKLQGLLV